VASPEIQKQVSRISVDEALNLVLSNLPARRAEEVPFQAALGRVLAQDFAATQNVPPFTRSAMDGYALRAAETTRAPVELEYAGTIRAGGGEPGSIGPGQAKAIMTGAPVPSGADAVQIVERCRLTDDGRKVAILKAVTAGENIAPLGNEATLGETVLESGRYVGPAEIAVLAGFGCSQIEVWKRPTVALFATGDELVEVAESPRPDQIRNSNAYSLLAQLRLLGLKAEYLGIARDDKQDLQAMLTRGLEHELVILTGGVSMGEYDLAKDVFLDLGFEILFSRVAMRPGKPTVFARRGSNLVFGLPGNPVSTFVAFENFVRPALARLCGHKKPDLPRIRGELMQDLRQVPGRTSFLPSWVSFEDGQWKVEPLRWKGSADIIAFSRANAAVIVPAESGFVAKGERVEAMLFPDHFSRSR
jgi:molybdopterin molybdotransferase